MTKQNGSYAFLRYPTQFRPNVLLGAFSDCGYVPTFLANVLADVVCGVWCVVLRAGSEDSTVKLWSLPEGGLTECSMGADDALADLTFSYTSIRRVDPFPVPRVFATSLLTLLALLIAFVFTLLLALLPAVLLTVSLALLLA